MRIGIGSLNKVKVFACKQAFTDVLETFGEDGNQDSTEFRSAETQTGIPDMPLTMDELLRGARERAFFVYDHLNAEGWPPTYAIGMEGGVYKLISETQQETAVLQSWVFAYNGKQGYYACSPAISLPPAIVKPLFEEHKELAPVIDQLSGKKDVRSNEGTFGVLSRGLITRSDSFRMAITNAIIPFFNQQYYNQRK